MMKKRWVTGAVLLGMVVVLTACQMQPKGWLVMTRKRSITQVDWTPDQLRAETANHTFHSTREASFHILRLRTAEKPHIHKRHDLTITVLSGRVKMHMDPRTVIVEPGNVIYIPKGVMHWAQNLDKNASEAYAVFIPPFEGKDFHPVSIPR